METLPNEVLLRIMLDLSIPDLIRSRAINKQINEISNDDYFWRLRLEHDYPKASIPSTIGEPDHPTYQQLYMFWYHRPTGASRLIEIPVDVFNPEDFGFNPSGANGLEEQEEIARLLNSNPRVQEFLRQQKISRGDVIHLAAVGEYRNNGKWIYDGNDVIPLDYSLDDYGAVPASFQVIDEFPIHYWEKTIAHNCIVHLNMETYLDEVMVNLRCNEVTQFGVVCASKFTYWTGEKYTIIIPLEDPVSDIEIRRRLATGIFSHCDELGVTEEEARYDPNTTLFLSIYSQSPSE